MNSSVAPRAGRRVRRRGVLGGAIGVLATGGVGTAWALDRSVVEHPEVADASSHWRSAEPLTTATAQGTSTGAGLAVTKVVTGSGSGTVTYYVAKLTLSNILFLAG